MPVPTPAALRAGLDRLLAERGTPLVIAHRGTTLGSFPDNTVRSAIGALRSGADVVELTGPICCAPISRRGDSAGGQPGSFSKDPMSGNRSARNARTCRSTTSDGSSCTASFRQKVCRVSLSAISRRSSAAAVCSPMPT